MYIVNLLCRMVNSQPYEDEVLSRHIRCGYILNSKLIFSPFIFIFKVFLAFCHLNLIIRTYNLT